MSAIKKTRKKRSFWTDDTESIFIDMWEEKIEELRGKRKNSHIYKEMAAELLKSGIEVSPEEVKAKITNLTIKFRNCKASIGPSGGSPSNWVHYYKICRIIGSHPINNMETIVEDSINIQDSQSEDVTPTIEGLPESPHTPSIHSSMASPDDRPSSSRAAKNRKLYEMFEKLGETFERAMDEDKKCTEELMKIEREKLSIFKGIKDSTDRLTSAVVDFLKISRDTNL